MQWNDLQELMRLIEKTNHSYLMCYTKFLKPTLYNFKQLFLVMQVQVGCGPVDNFLDSL